MKSARRWARSPVLLAVAAVGVGLHGRLCGSGSFSHRILGLCSAGFLQALAWLLVWAAVGRPLNSLHIEFQKVPAARLPFDSSLILQVHWLAKALAICLPSQSVMSGAPQATSQRSIIQRGHRQM